MSTGPSSKSQFSYDSVFEYVYSDVKLHIIVQCQTLSAYLVRVPSSLLVNVC